MTSKMKNTHKQWRYYHANLLRTLLSGKRIAAVLIMLAVNAGIVALIEYSATTSTGVWNSYLAFLGFLTMYISVMECILVYSDEFKAKTMQSAIGRGIKRRHVVLCKFMELATTLLIDYVLLALGFIIVNSMMPVRLEWSQLVVVMITYACRYLANIAIISLAMIPAFYLQTAGASILIFLGVNSGLLGGVLGALGNSFNVNLQAYLVNELAQRFEAYLMVEVFSVKIFIGILLWMLVSYILTALLFDRKELDF